MIKGLAVQLAVEWLHCSKYVLDQTYIKHQTIVGDVISRLCLLDSHHMQFSPLVTCEQYGDTLSSISQAVSRDPP